MKYSKLKKKQSGVALAIGIILLLIIAVLGITSMKSAILQIKMTGSFQNRNHADQAGYSLLTSVENYLFTHYKTSSGENSLTCDYCENVDRHETYNNWYNFNKDRNMSLGRDYTDLPQANIAPQLFDKSMNPPRFYLYQMKKDNNVQEFGDDADAPTLTYFNISTKAQDTTGNYFVLYQSTHAVVQ